MRWRTEPLRVFVGPGGLRLDDRPATTPPLSPASLAQALNTLALPAGTRVVVVVDDEWVKTLLLPLPEALHVRDEIRSYAAQRLRDTFPVGPGHWPQAWPRRGSPPWPDARWQRPMNPLLVAGLAPELLRTISDWRRSRRLRLVRLGTAWSEALRKVPPSPRGALAVLQGRRMTVGAWSERRWLGWRSFLTADAAGAGAETLRWLSSLDAGTAPGRLWCQGWQASPDPDREGARSGTWTAQTLQAELPGRRPASFDFRSQLPGDGATLRHRVLGLALLATLAASLWVTLPMTETGPESLSVVDARPPSPRPPADEAVPVFPVDPGQAGDEPARVEAEPAVSESETAAEEIGWPRILGTFEQQGQRWVLYSSAAETGMLRQGAIIDQRYRIERAEPTRIVLTDLQTLQQQQTVLEHEEDSP